MCLCLCVRVLVCLWVHTFFVVYRDLYLLPIEKIRKFKARASANFVVEREFLDMKNGPKYCG